MITNRILTLTIIDGLPVVPGAYQVSEQCDGWYTAELAAAPNISGNTRWTHPHYAALFAIKIGPSSGVFAVFATKENMAKIDAGNTGEVMTAYKLTASVRQWPVWRVDGTMKTKDLEGKDVTVPVTNMAVRPSLPVPATPASALSPWTIGNVTATAARPSIPSTMGDTDLIDNLDKATKALEL